MRGILILISLSLFVIRCSEKNCNRFISCTENLIIISTEVQDSDGNSLKLDSTQTRNSNGGIIFKYVRTANEDVRFYTITTDMEDAQIDFDGTHLILFGWQNGELKVNQEYMIGKDCCHIEKIDGPDIIIN